MNNDYMVTYTGKKVYPFNMQIKDLDIIDIAHSLSLQCRFNGHVSKFYSVAEHSVLMSKYIIPVAAKWALMHDAAETYLPDVCHGVKHKHFLRLIDVENKITKLIEKRFQLGDFDSVKDVVKRLDTDMCLIEGRLLMPSHPDAQWQIGKVCPKIEIKCWSPLEAKAQFLYRVTELGII
jgi:hypothetical protein